jgi:hypothetical protein
VQVRIIEVEWIKKNLRDFYKFLKEKSDPGLFDNELIKVLLTEQDYSA